MIVNDGRNIQKGLISNVACKDKHEYIIMLHVHYGTSYMGKRDSMGVIR